MVHARKPDFVFQWNRRVHLNWWGHHFSRLLAAEVCASAVVMLDTPCSEVVWWVPCHYQFSANSIHRTFYTSWVIIWWSLVSNKGKNSRVTVGVWKWFGQRLPFRQITSCEIAPFIVGWCGLSRLRLKCDGTRAETRFCLPAKRTSLFKLARASVQSTTGSRGVLISGSNAGYTMFQGSVKSTGYPLHSPVSLSLPLPCVTMCHHISTGL
jgi:hypothetical protein